jgi:hypothetical protein
MHTSNSSDSLHWQIEREQVELQSSSDHHQTKGPGYTNVIVIETFVGPDALASLL